MNRCSDAAWPPVVLAAGFQEAYYYHHSILITGKDVGGHGCGQVWSTIQEFAWWDWEKLQATSCRIVSVPLRFERNTLWIQVRNIMASASFLCRAYTGQNINVSLFLDHDHQVTPSLEVELITPIIYDSFTFCQLLPNLLLPQLHSLLPWRWRQCVPLQCWYSHTRLHGVMALRITVYMCVWNCSRDSASTPSEILLNHVSPLWWRPVNKHISCAAISDGR